MEDKAQNPFASNGRYNLFRPLTALLDLPKMPFSRLEGAQMFLAFCPSEPIVLALVSVNRAR
jgi:hypothetical protein